MTNPDADLLAAWEEYTDAARSSFSPPPGTSGEEFVASAGRAKAARDRIAQMAATTPEGMVIQAKIMLINKCPTLERALVFGEPLPAEPPDASADTRLAWNNLKNCEALAAAEEDKRTHGGWRRLS